MNIKFSGLDKTLAILNPKIYKKALNRTVNDIGAKTRTQMVKAVRKAYNIRATKLKQHMQIKRSRYDDMQYVMHIQSRRRNVMNFAAKKLRANGKVSVKIKKDRGRATLRHAFIAKNGAVLHRIGNTQEVEGVTTLSITQMFNKKIVKEASDMAAKEFDKKLQSNFNFYINKVK